MKDEPYSNVEKSGVNNLQSVAFQSGGNVLNNVATVKESKNKSPRISRRRKKRRTHKAEVKEKDDGFPFDSPVMGEREPLWSHRYSAKLQAAASNIYQAWCEGEADGWTLSTNHKSGLQIFRKKRTAGVDIIKGVILIPYPLSMILGEVNCVESRLKFDATAEDCKKLATYGQGGGVQYMLLTRPSRLISPRDLVTAYDCCLVEKGGNVLLYPHTSIVFDSYPTNSGIIRAELKFGGWVFEVKSPGSTEASYIIDIDIKGSIPGYIANQSTEDAGRMPLNVSKFMKEKYGPYIPTQRMRSRKGYIAPHHGDDDGLIYGTEDDMDDSIEYSSGESLEPIADQTVTETPALIQLGDSRLTTHQQATIITKLNVTIADVEKFTDGSSKNLWKRTTSKDNGVKIYRRKDGKSGYMGKSIVKFEPQKIFEALKEPSFRNNFDPMLMSLQVVEQLGDLYVVHMQHQTKNCMAKIRRDMLLAWGSRQVGTKYVVAGTSITHPACPENTRMHRINIGVSGWVVEEYSKRPGYSMVYFIIVNMDCGQLPEKVVRYVYKRQVMGIHDLALAIKRRDENGI